MTVEEPFPQSLCHRCRSVKKVTGANSTFLMCTALPVKYPRQPVAACPAFAPIDAPAPP